MSAQKLGTPPPNLNVTATPHMAFEPGGFWRRLAATFIDGIVLTVMRFPIQIVALLLLPKDVGGLVSAAVSIAAFIYYYGWFYSKKGATPGKMVMGLKVLDEATGTHLTFRRAFNREVTKNVLAFLTLGISYLFAGFRSDKKTLGDMASKTRVVHIKS